MFKYIIIFILFSICLVFADENSEYNTGYFDGKQIAEGEEIWFYMGLFTGPLGLGASFILYPTSLPHNINYINETDNYLEGYLKGYKDETALKNIQFASTGLFTLISIFWAIEI